MNPFYQRARFLTAAGRLADAPADLGREIAFAGRSNAGKSSAINALCHQGGLARTSKTPGRTQQLIFFSLDQERRFVDLPGYGYAKVAAAIKHQWQSLMTDYLERRQSLVGLVVLMDVRHPLTDLDEQVLGWGERSGLPVLILLTKADKLRRGPASAVREQVAAATRGAKETRVELFSAVTRQGLETVQCCLDNWLGIAPAPPAEPRPGQTRR